MGRSCAERASRHSATAVEIDGLISLHLVGDAEDLLADRLAHFFSGAGQPVRTSPTPQPCARPFQLRRPTRDSPKFLPDQRSGASDFQKLGLSPKFKARVSFGISGRVATKFWRNSRASARLGVRTNDRTGRSRTRLSVRFREPGFSAACFPKNPGARRGFSSAGLSSDRERRIPPLELARVAEYAGLARPDFRPRGGEEQAHEARLARRLPHLSAGRETRVGVPGDRRVARPRNCSGFRDDFLVL